MKSFTKYILSFALLAFASSQALAQEKDTSMVVNGLCNMCKATIENAADIKGVSMATWSPETKVLQFTYDPSKVDYMEISEAVNKSGYDTEFSTASEEAYQGLHKCCHYRDPEVIKAHENE